MKSKEPQSGPLDFLKYEVSQEMGLGKKSKNQEDEKDIKK